MRERGNGEEECPAEEIAVPVALPVNSGKVPLLDGMTIKPGAKGVIGNA